MPRSIGGQIDEGGALDAMNEDQSKILEKGFDNDGDFNIENALEDVPDKKIRERIIADIKRVYGDHQDIFNQKYEKETGEKLITHTETESDDSVILHHPFVAHRLKDVTREIKRKKVEVASPKNKEVILRIAQEMYGPFFHDSEVLLNRVMKTKNIEGILSNVLEDGLPADEEQLKGRKYLRAALYRLSAIPENEMEKFLRDALKLVDPGELAKAEGAEEPLKEKYEFLKKASAYFRKKDHLVLDEKLKKLDKVFENPYFAGHKNESIKTIINSLEIEIDTKKRNVSSLPASDAPDKNNGGNSWSAVVKRKKKPVSAPVSKSRQEKADIWNAEIAEKDTLLKVIKEIKFEEFYGDLKTFTQHVNRCDELGLKVGCGQKKIILSEDISYNDVKGLYGGSTLTNFVKDPIGLADQIGKKSGSAFEEYSRHDNKLSRMRGQEKKVSNFTDEQLAEAINVHLMTKNPKTSSLSKQQKAEYSKAMVLQDFTTMDNEDYFNGVSESVNEEPVKDAKLAEMLKFSYKVLDAENPQAAGKAEFPLIKLGVKDLGNQLSIERAIRASKIDWKAAFVLMVYFEKNGEKNSDRFRQIERTARKLLAKQLGVKIDAPECESAFQDQVAMLEPVIEAHMKNFSAEQSAQGTANLEFTKSCEAWIEEGLRQGTFEEEDYDVVMADLKSMGYFEAKAKIKQVDKDGVNVNSEDAAMAKFKAMFERIPKDQAALDRGHAVGKQALGLGKKAFWTGGKLMLGYTKFAALTLPVKALKYGVFRPVHLVGRMIRHPLHPIQNIKNTFGDIVSDVKGDVSAVKNKSVELGQRAVAGAKAGFGHTVEAGKQSIRKKSELGESAYKSRTKLSTEKLKAKASQLGKKSLTPKLELTEQPFINLDKYRQNLKATG